MIKKKKEAERAREAQREKGREAERVRERQRGKD